LSFQDQTSVTINGQEWVIGEKEGGSGQVTMNGARSSLTFQGELKIGAEGSATLSLRTGANAKFNSITIGEARKSNGLLLVDGRNSKLEVVREFTSGSAGSATLLVTNNATLWIDADTSLASELGSLSVATVTSNSVLQVLGDLSVGEKGIAGLTLESGSQCLALGSSATLGEEPGSGGTMTIGSQSTNDSPAAVRLAGELKVGERGNGLLILTNGGVLFPATNQNAVVTLAAERGSVGRTVISGNTSVLAASVLNIGGTADEGGGDGSLTLTNGGRGQIAQQVNFWPSGSLDVNSGTLTVGLTNSAPPTGTVLINTGGTMRACGAITGQLLNSGGQLQASCTSESLRVTGDFEQMNPGTLSIVLDSSSLTALPPLVINGKASLGGTLSLVFTNGFAPGVGTSLCLIQFGTLAGHFDQVNVAGLAPGFQYALQDSGLGTYCLVALNQGVPTSPPALSVVRTGNQLQISWPTAGQGFMLQSSTNLGAIWADLNGASNPLVISPQDHARFFRLHRAGN
jgi:T5SS/PEP-CTERM-associated repeat protein